MLSELSALTEGAGSGAAAPHIDGQNSQGVFRGFSWRGTNNFPHSPGTFRIRPGQRYIPELNWPRLDNPFSRRQAEPALGILRPLMRLHERALVHAENLIRQGVTANENVIARLGSACIGNCTPDVQSDVGMTIRSFERTLYRASGYFDWFSNIEYRYPEIALDSTRRWRLIREACDRYARAANRRVQDAAFSQGRAKPWSGPAGEAYAAHLPDQETAARAMVDFADKVMAMLFSTKQGFQGVLNALRTLGATLISAASGITGSMTTLPSPIRRPDGVGFILGVQAWLHGSLPAFDGYQTTLSRFEDDMQEKIRDLTYVMETPTTHFPEAGGPTRRDLVRWRQT